MQVCVDESWVYAMEIWLWYFLRKFSPKCNDTYACDVCVWELQNGNSGLVIVVVDVVDVHVVHVVVVVFVIIVAGLGLLVRICPIYIVPFRLGIAYV